MLFGINLFNQNESVHLDFLVLGDKLDVERPRDVERVCDQLGGVFDLAHCFGVEILRRELLFSFFFIHLIIGW